MRLIYGHVAHLTASLESQPGLGPSIAKVHNLKLHRLIKCPGAGVCICAGDLCDLTFGDRGVAFLISDKNYSSAMLTRLDVSRVDEPPSTKATFVVKISDPLKVVPSIDWFSTFFES